MPVYHLPYSPRSILKNAHVQTIFPSLFRRPKVPPAKRKTIKTPDGDFIDILHYTQGSLYAVCIIHGMESHAEDNNVGGMVRALYTNGLDVIAMNLRGCSGRPNRLIRYYHAGSSDDVNSVVSNILQQENYLRFVLIGFSLGGNIILKYLGERGEMLDSRIYAGIAISVPLDLASAAKKLAQAENTFYMSRFIRSYHHKIRMKMKQFPGKIDDRPFQYIKTFQQLDDVYTAPLHGFKDAQDYWNRTSSLYFLESIQIPVLILNAADDPFLTPSCFPIDICNQSPNVYLEIPTYGGHCGFVLFNKEKLYLHEQRTLRFLTELNSKHALLTKTKSNDHVSIASSKLKKPNYYRRSQYDYSDRR